MKTLKDINPEDIVGFEPMNITYCPSYDKTSDMLVVKENVHLKDGSTIPNLKLVKDYRRPFWVTQKGEQNHKDKLQWESKERLNEFECCQFELAAKAHAALGRYGTDRGLRSVLESPYLYGANISSKALLRADYRARWPKAISPKTKVAVLDIETDVLHGTNEIILNSVTFGDKVVVTILNRFLGVTKESEDRWREVVSRRVEELLADHIKARNITIEYLFVDTPAACVTECIDKAHEWQPDLIAVWNIGFDMPKMITALENENIDPASVFSDPRVPRSYKMFKWVPGPQTKTTHDGKVFPKNIEEKWPYVDCPAGFYWIDAMCLYAKLRFAGGKEESYALDSVMKRNVNMGKLKFAETDHLSSIDWHVEMQRNYKLEYIAYNIFDCIGIEILDEKTGDMSAAFVPQADVTDWENFSSDPSKIADGMHFQCLTENHVVGTCAGDIRVEDDGFVVKPRGWIVTLAAYLAQDVGLKIIKDVPHKQTMATMHNADLDIEGTYPSIQVAMNACKETTVREIVQIEGLDEISKRTIGVNLSAGAVNMCRIAEVGYKAPDKMTLLNALMGG